MVKLKILTRVQPEVHPAKGKEGLFTNKMHYLNEHLLRELKDKVWAAPFMQPVDTKVLRVPNYYKVIRNPMDLGTIIKRVRNKFYRSATELVKDLKLVVTNCYTFYLRSFDMDMYHSGLKLERFVRKVVKKIPQGEELPYVKEEKECPETSRLQRECQAKLKVLLDEAEKMKQPEREFFHDKWMELSRKLEKDRPSSMKEFDECVLNTLKECRHQPNRIFQYYESDSDDIPGVSENACHYPNFKWQDSVIDDLDHRIKSFEEALAKARKEGRVRLYNMLDQVLKNIKAKEELMKQKQLMEIDHNKNKIKESQEQANLVEMEQKTNMESWEQEQLEMGLDENMVSWELMEMQQNENKKNESQEQDDGKNAMAQVKKHIRTNLVESSDDEGGQSNSVNIWERQVLQSQFEKCSPETTRDKKNESQEQDDGKNAMAQVKKHIRTNLVESSDDEGGQSNSVNIWERQVLQSQFEKCSPETMHDIMFFIEESENRDSADDRNRKLNVMSLSRTTMMLVKRAMDNDKRPKRKKTL